MICAKNAVYWPGMYKEIQILVGTCRAYKKFENAQVPFKRFAVEWEFEMVLSSPE